MTLFWIAAAALAGAAALLVMLFARRGARGVGGENPALAVHRRQLSEIDDLAERGLLNDPDRAAARAEAGRRLLSAAAAGEAPETAGGARSRWIAALAAVAAGLLALVLYTRLGAPGAADQPYTARVEAWRRSDPSSLDAARMAAVLRDLAAARPSDPQVWGFLGRAELASGDAYGAQKAFARAAALAPNRADLQAGLGEALFDQADGKPSPAGEAAFRRALSLDPRMPIALYILGRAEIERGDRAGGLALWRTLLAELPSPDPRRAALSMAADRVAAGGPPDAPPPPVPASAAMAGDASAFIRAMVANLAAKLKAAPDDPAGWARLVRSYGVLHDARGQAAALAAARRQFAGRPAALQPIEAEAKAHPAG